MLETLEFLGIIACGAIAVVWFLQNVRTEGEASRGLLALAEAPVESRPEARRKSYRIKQRLARRAHEQRDAEGAKAVTEAKPAFRKLTDAQRMRLRFRRQDDARYRVKDKAAGFKPEADPNAA